MSQFKIKFESSEIKDLRERLQSTRWPAQDVAPSKSGEQPYGYGIETGELKPLAQAWEQFDFEAFEKSLNNFDHFIAEIENVKLHYIHKKSSRSDAKPLVLLHGWPGGFTEFTQVIEPLANPASNDLPAFHVVVVSLPGFAWSTIPQSDKWTLHDTARIINHLMADNLGYFQYAAQGGDWGSLVARILGSKHPENCIAVHINFLPLAPPEWVMNALPMNKILDFMNRWGLIGPKGHAKAIQSLTMNAHSVYYNMQRITPQTPAFALADSPVGLLAWLAEKTVKWRGTSTKDLLEMATINWFTNSINTQFNLYAFNPYFPANIGPNKLPNFAFSIFPGELGTPPIKDAAKTGNLRWHKEASEGGHFPAWECPSIFVDHIRESMTVLFTPPTNDQK